MRRGEIWTAAGGPDYAGKPRPVVIIQDDLFAGGDSVTICAFATNRVGTNNVRISVAPDSANGLRSQAQLMVDKVTTLPVTKLGHRIGILSTADMQRVSSAVAVFLGLAG